VQQPGEEWSLLVSWRLKEEEDKAKAEAAEQQKPDKMATEEVALEW
jgi:hypothetical protein